MTKAPASGFNGFGFRRGTVDLTEIPEAVLEFCAADGVSLIDHRTQVAQGLLTAVRRIGVQATEIQLGGPKLSYQSPSRPCPCGQTQRFVEYRPFPTTSGSGGARAGGGGSQDVLSSRVAWLNEGWDRRWDARLLARAA